jgi:multiple sugar transport system substrate-binding protein
VHLPRKLFALATLVALGAVAACGGGGSTGDKSQGVVKLSFWNGFTGGDRPAVEHLVQQFNQTHPKIHIDMQIMPWDVFYDKLLPAYGAGKGPDMTAMNSSQLPVYASKGLFRPLDDAMTPGPVEKATLVPGAVRAGQFRGKQYGIAANFTPLMLYYNKKLFKAAGIKTPPATWDEWAADLKKLTKAGTPPRYGLAVGTHDTVEIIPLLLQGGGGGVVSPDGKTVTFDSPQSIQAMNYWTALIRDSKIAPVGNSGADADKLMQSGAAAMEVNGPWLTSSLDDAKVDYGVAMVPAGPAGQTTLADSTVFSVSSKASSAKKKAAEEFMGFWNSKPSQVYFSGVAGFPPTRTDVSPGELKNPAVAAFSQFAPKATPFMGGQTNFGQIQREILDPAITKILNGKGDPATLMKQAAAQIRPMLSPAG